MVLLGPLSPPRSLTVLFTSCFLQRQVVTPRGADAHTLPAAPCLSTVIWCTVVYWLSFVQQQDSRGIEDNSDGGS